MRKILTIATVAAILSLGTAHAEEIDIPANATPADISALVGGQPVAERDIHNLEAVLALANTETANNGLVTGNIERTPYGIATVTFDVTEAFHLRLLNGKGEKIPEIWFRTSK